MSSVITELDFVTYFCRFSDLLFARILFSIESEQKPYTFVDFKKSRWQMTAYHHFKYCLIAHTKNEEITLVFSMAWMNSVLLFFCVDFFFRARADMRKFKALYSDFIGTENSVWARHFNRSHAFWNVFCNYKNLTIVVESKDLKSKILQDKSRIEKLELHFLLKWKIQHFK